MSTFTNDGTENRMRWDREARGFMEVWYATVNHAASGAGIWLRYTLTAPEEPTHEAYCELWGFLFDPQGERSFAARQRYGIERLGSANGRDDGALVRIGDAWLSETHLEGGVSDGTRSLTWSLDLEPADRTFQHLPPQLRARLEKRVSTLCSPNLSVPFSGTVELDGAVLELDGESGCQSHRWGRRHSTTWAWAHCSRFDSDADAVFEGIAARARLGPVPLPTSTLLYLRHDDLELSFNEVRSILRGRSRYELPAWSFSGRTDRFRIEGTARARVKDMVQVAYADPDGSARHCANSEIAQLALEVYERSGAAWRHRASLGATGSAHFELGRPDPFPELPVSF